MIVYAAIDLRHGRVVQLVGGRPEHERVSLPDPKAVARRFVSAGFVALHVVDLDGALQQGSNAGDVEGIIGAVDVPVQVGGGVRDEEGVRRWLEAGAARVMVGTRAVTDPQWLRRVSTLFPSRLLVAADVRDDVIVTHGWTRSSGLSTRDFFVRASDHPLAGLLVTDVGREGSLSGIDSGLFARLVDLTDLPIIAAGGIGTLQDLHDLDAAGIAGAVVGTALYTGAIDFRAVTREFTHDQAS
jgi:phosphoribosylformimino-5-aminoimidazole carboxamide ribotide isomerase